MKLLQSPAVSVLFGEAFHREILHSAYAHLENEADPFRCSLFAQMLRELLRLNLDWRAPDAVVENAPWFGSGHVTSQDRHRGALIGRLAEDKLPGYADADAESPLALGDTLESLTALEETLTRQAQFTPDTHALPPTQAEAYIAEVEATVIAYAELFTRTHAAVHSALWEAMQEAVYETLGSLDFQATVPEGIVLTGEFQMMEPGTYHLFSAPPYVTGTLEVELETADATNATSRWHTLPYRIAFDPDSLDVSEAEILPP